jgi:hypothetical protein
MSLLTNGFYDITVDSYGNIFDNTTSSLISGYGSNWYVGGQLTTSNIIPTTTTPTPTPTQPEEERAINLNKIAEMDVNVRDLIMLIIAEYNKADYTTKKLFENTLEAYGIFDTKDSLIRKNKINDVLK